MAWGTVNVDDQRMRFVIWASRPGTTMREACEEFKISRPTGYEWLRRYQAGGIAGVVEKSRRPLHSPTQTAVEIEQRVVELRQQRPDWGARKLQILLAREEIALPAVTVHRILLRRGLVRPQDRFHRAVQRFERGAANQLWQMDFKSPVGWDAPVGPLSVLDDHSRYAIALERTGSTQGEPVKQRLIEAFQRCGTPGNADGSRHSVVEHESGGGPDVADGVADATRNPVALQRVSASADTRKNRAIPWSAGSGDEAARNTGEPGAAVVAR